jgi:hypothetical protein
MNEHLAKLIAEIIREKWDDINETIYSEGIHEELIARGEEVPEGAMSEIFDIFTRARLIDGKRFVDRAGNQEHGAMRIESVDLALLSEVEFD